MREIVDAADLVEITTICIDKELPQDERRSEFMRQVKDMHNYKSETMTVRAVYAKDGTTIEDCLRGILY
ncbi:MAG: hypothetical protein FWE20_11310 [Defluviitaleaceae bacterium]|nr:hypothetical protein [Defluviitaleaceae bacterium]